MAESSAIAPVVHLSIAPPDRHDGRHSYSQLSRFTQCPLSFKLHYLDRLPAESSAERRFGQALLQTLQHAVHDHVRRERTGPLDRAYAAEAYREAWAFHGLSDPGLFAEGLELVERWLAREGEVDWSDVLDIEREFDFAIEGRRIFGTMARVDRMGPAAIRVRAYKTTRAPLRREDAEESLQLAIYDLAARELWPWAERIELGFDLLRHDVVLTVERNAAQRQAAAEYMRATIAQIERGDFPARPSTRCAYCDHRAQCPAWADARAGRRAHAGANEDDLAAVAREREELAVVLRALGERKDALDDVLRTALEHQGGLFLQGHRYALVTALRRDYPLAATLDALEAAGVPRESGLAKLGAVDGGALKALLAGLRASLEPEALRALQARLDAHVRLSPSPRLTSRPVRP